jgi:hypothetical protein
MVIGYRYQLAVIAYSYSILAVSVGNVSSSLSPLSELTILADLQQENIRLFRYRLSSMYRTKKYVVSSAKKLPGPRIH